MKEYTQEQLKQALAVAPIKVKEEFQAKGMVMAKNYLYMFGGILGVVVFLVLMIVALFIKNPILGLVATLSLGGSVLFIKITFNKVQEVIKWINKTLGEYIQ